VTNFISILAGIWLAGCTLMIIELARGYSAHREKGTIESTRRGSRVHDGVRQRDESQHVEQPNTVRMKIPARVSSELAQLRDAA
jgi:hypothetical protein